MKPILIAASIIVTLALISYSIGFFSEFGKKILNRKVVTFMALGLLLDISGTICMIIGSANSAFTAHGLIGYSGLMGMLVDNLLFWHLWKTKGISASVPRNVHIYSVIAYTWWVFVYISGALLAAAR